MCDCGHCYVRPSDVGVPPDAFPHDSTTKALKSNTLIIKDWVGFTDMNMEARAMTHIHPFSTAKRLAEEFFERFAVFWRALDDFFPCFVIGLLDPGFALGTFKLDDLHACFCTGIHAPF